MLSEFVYGARSVTQAPQGRSSNRKLPAESTLRGRQISRFIEDDRVPKDARIVDTTWRYVNKRGGPDKRFKNNKELPVVLYDELQLSSSSGLLEHFQISMTGVADKFRNAVLELRPR